jgi:hypothetical protein
MEIVAREGMSIHKTAEQAFDRSVQGTMSKCGSIFLKLCHFPTLETNHVRDQKGNPKRSKS